MSKIQRKIDDRTLDLPFGEPTDGKLTEDPDAQLEREREENRRDQEQLHERPTGGQVRRWLEGLRGGKG